MEKNEMPTILAHRDEETFYQTRCDKELQHSNIFNADKAGLYWKAKPDPNIHNEKRSCVRQQKL